jgi:hypothetical protein
MNSSEKPSEDDEKQGAEVRKLDAERKKLGLEAQEIEQRLNARWWEGQKLPGLYNRLQGE